MLSWMLELLEQRQYSEIFKEIFGSLMEGFDQYWKDLIESEYKTWITEHSRGGNTLWVCVTHQCATQSFQSEESVAIDCIDWATDSMCYRGANMRPSGHFLGIWSYSLLSWCVLVRPRNPRDNYIIKGMFHKVWFDNGHFTYSWNEITSKGWCNHCVKETPW